MEKLRIRIIRSGIKDDFILSGEIKNGLVLSGGIIWH